MSDIPSHNHLQDLSKESAKRLALALSVTAAFVVVEAVAGFWGNSLALLTDAAHNFTDVIALGVSWIALRLAGQQPNAGKTYGYHRAGILAALANSTTLGVIALGIFYEAYRRLTAPPQINTSILIGVGLAAFLINVWTAMLIKRGSEHDLNLRSAFLHLMGDVLSTLGAVAAGVVILFTGLNWLDPLVSILIGGLILWNAWIIIRQTIHILLEGTPENVDVDRMITDLLRIEGVLGVHDLHVWSINESLRALSAHIVTEDIQISRGTSIQQDINQLLSQKYNIRHATLQLECEQCGNNLMYCNILE